MMDEALPLVELESSADENLKVSEKALKEIEKIPEGYGITTKAIVGPGRIGKSSLINWLAGKKVFQIGSKMSRVTQGIWMYIDLNHERRIANIYIDVEGFGDPSKPNVDENDNRLLNIVIQICDVILYNIKGVYDSDMRNKIQFVCNLFKRYRKGNTVLEKPILISVLRDFDLDPPENPDEEFRNLFKENQAVLDTFRETKTFTLVKPKEGRMVDLTKTPDEGLDKQFVQERNKMKQYLLETSRPLRARHNFTISGNILAENIRKTVKLVNDDDLRMLSKCLPELFEEKNAKTKKSALDTYKSEMEKRWPGQSEEEILMKLHSEQKNAASALIQEKCFEIPGVIDIDKGSCMEEIEKAFQTMYENECKNALESVCSEIKRKYDQDEYFKDGGTECFSNDFDNAEATYKGLNNLGPETAKLQAWESFKNEWAAERKKIIKDRGRANEEKKELAESKDKMAAEALKLQREKEMVADLKQNFEKMQSQNSTLNTALSVMSAVVEVGRGATEIARNMYEERSPERSTLTIHMASPIGAGSGAGNTESTSSRQPSGDPFGKHYHVWWVACCCVCGYTGFALFLVIASNTPDTNTRETHNYI